MHFLILLFSQQAFEVISAAFDLSKSLFTDTQSQWLGWICKILSYMFWFDWSHRRSRFRSNFIQIWKDAFSESGTEGDGLNTVPSLACFWPPNSYGGEWKQV